MKEFLNVAFAVCTLGSIISCLLLIGIIDKRQNKISQKVESLNHELNYQNFRISQNLVNYYTNKDQLNDEDRLQLNLAKDVIRKFEIMYPDFSTKGL